MNAGGGANTHLLPHIAIAGTPATASTNNDGSAQTQQQQVVGNYRPSDHDEQSESSKTSSCRDDVDAALGSGRVRIQPIDTRIRLHMKQTQVCTLDRVK